MCYLIIFFRFAIKKIFFSTPAGEIRKQYAVGLSFFTRKSKKRAQKESPTLQDTRLVLNVARGRMDKNDITDPKAIRRWNLEIRRKELQE